MGKIIWLRLKCCFSSLLNRDSGFEAISASDAKTSHGLIRSRKKINKTLKRNWKNCRYKDVIVSYNFLDTLGKEYANKGWVVEPKMARDKYGFVDYHFLRFWNPDIFGKIKRQTK